jgi:hypothetical protein
VHRGADMSRVDKNGRTPREVIKSGNHDLIDVLTPQVDLEQDMQVNMICNGYCDGTSCSLCCVEGG